MKKFIILFLILFFGIFLFQGEVLLAADSDIPGLDELGEAPATGDKIHVIDVSDTSMASDGTDKWISIQNLLDGTTKNTDTDISGNSWVVDEDNLSSDLDTKVPTQQSVKAYVDTKQDTLVSATNIKTVGGVSLLGAGDLGIIGAAYGGTGVANNAANMITFTGSYALGITLTGATSLTFPTSGTLITTTDIAAFDSEDEIEAFIFDSDAETITGNWEVQNNVHFSFGNSDNFSLRYNSTSGNFELVNAANSPLMWVSTAGVISGASQSSPVASLFDSDAAGSDRADELVISLYGQMTTITEDGEIGDFRLASMGTATAGTMYSNLWFDSSAQALYMGIMSDADAPADVAGYEHLKWDFDTGTDGQVEISAGGGGTDELVLTNINLTAKPDLVLVDDTDSDSTISAGNINKTHLITDTDTHDYDIADGLCDDATDLNNWVVIRKKFDFGANTISITSNDASNIFVLDDNTDTTAGDELDMADGCHQVCLMCFAVEYWYVTGYIGTAPTDGGVAD